MQRVEAVPVPAQARHGSHRQSYQAKKLSAETFLPLDDSRHLYRCLWNRTVKQEEKPQFVGDDVPTIESVFDLKSGARAKLVDRSGSMVIIEIDKYRSDWIEWSEIKARIAAKDR